MVFTSLEKVMSKFKKYIIGIGFGYLILWSYSSKCQDTKLDPYFSVGISPIAPVLGEGWDFSVTSHFQKKWSFTVIYRGGFRSENGGLLDQMFVEYDNVRLDINHTLVLNPRFHVLRKKGLNHGPYIGALLGYETWTIQSRDNITLGVEEKEGNPYSGFNLGHIWYPGMKKKEHPRFFVDAYMHFLWKLDETEAQVVGGQNYQIRSFAVTFFPTIHLGCKF